MDYRRDSTVETGAPAPNASPQPSPEGVPVKPGGRSSPGRAPVRPNISREARLRVPRPFRSLGARHVYRVIGESMSRFGLHDADLLYVRPLTRGNARSAVGGIVVVSLNGALFLKQLTVGSRGKVALRSGRSGEYCVTITPGDDCRPLGQVVASVRCLVDG